MFQSASKLNDQNGISVLLAVLILSSLIIMTIAISDIVLRVGRSSRAIGHSEIAYYAAETAVETALYDIEKNRTVAGLDGASDSLDDISGADWSRTVELITILTTECADIVGQEGVCVDNAGTISPSNPLKVQLDAGNSFQLELDFAGLSLPNNLQISWSGSAKIIADGASGLEIDSSSPANLSNLDANLYGIKIVNQEGSSMLTFQLSPAGDDLPIGILVTGTGSYKNEERILETERSNWQIY